jgi:hypothetical protein
MWTAKSVNQKNGPHDQLIFQNIQAAPIDAAWTD